MMKLDNLISFSTHYHAYKSDSRMVVTIVLLFYRSVSVIDPLVYQLQEILDPQQPPPWDAEKRYDFASVRV
jgi:hypothetical protein